MIFGPFPPHFVNRLRDKLESHKAECRIFTATESIDAFQRAAHKQEEQIYPNFLASDLLMIEIDPADLDLIKSDLSDMGVSFGSEIPEPVTGPEIFICPKCDHESAGPALCPMHRVPLISEEMWMQRDRLRRDTTQLLGKRVFGFFFLLVILWMASMFIKDAFGG